MRLVVQQPFSLSSILPGCEDDQLVIDESRLSYGQTSSTVKEQKNEAKRHKLRRVAWIFAGFSM